MEKPLIVQSDFTLLLETATTHFEVARDQLGLFAELVKSPEIIYTYKISPLSLWNAASAGMKGDEIVEILKTYSRYPIPEHIIIEINHLINRFGQVILDQKDPHTLRVSVKQDAIYQEMLIHPKLKPFNLIPDGFKSFTLLGHLRGDFKLNMIKIGYPILDLAGYEAGTTMPINLREKTLTDEIPFSLRPYQKTAVSLFHAEGSPYGGSGTIVLPCGSGKTIVGLGIIDALKTETLIISTNLTAIKQWQREITERTDIDPDQIGEYSSLKKEIKPITVASYQIVTYRKSKESPFEHFHLFNDRNWGLIIYDEVHLLPAPVFRVVSSLQSRRRLGLTATLIREDGKEEEVFSLIGPKKYDLPWKMLEKQGWIAKSTCTEYRIPLLDKERINYAVAGKRDQFKIASLNPQKMLIIDQLLEQHEQDHILIIGHYIDQLKAVAKRYNFPLITGKTPAKKRFELYGAFRRGEIKRLVVSKVANFAIDIPDANVAIQLSGTFGSRQEEAQRLGRILRPKSGDNKAYFYTIVSLNTVEQNFARNRQLFLTEQGYRYQLKIVAPEE